MLRLLGKLLVFMMLPFLFSSCVPKKIEDKPPIKISICVRPGYAMAFLAQESGTAF